MKHEPVRHEEAWELLAAAALDALDPDEMAAVMRHARGCETCSAEFGALREAAAQLAFAASAGAVPGSRRAAMRHRLLVHARADKEASTGERSGATVRSSRRLLRSLVAASMLLAASVAVVAWLAHDRARLADALRVASERGTAEQAVSDSLRDAVAERDTLIAGITGEDMSVVSLAANAPRQTWALMFWNRSTNGWTFIAYNLPQPAAGRTYQLWLVTTRGPISAGTFAPAPNGEAIVRATYALPRDALKAVAVTDEPTGGVPQPTGPFVVSGTGQNATR